MRSELAKVEKVFEGQALPAYLWEGKPVWVAKEVGRVMGYSEEGRGLIEIFRKDWKEELIEGTDFEILEGERLTSFKASLPNSSTLTPLVDPHSPRLLILKEPGFHLVCLKTDKPIGRRLRRWLVSEVMPSLVRTGGYQGTASANPRTIYDAHSSSALEAMAKKAEQGSIQAARLYFWMGGEGSALPSRPRPSVLDIFLPVVRDFAKANGEWEGTTAELLAALQSSTGRPSGWPLHLSRLSYLLRYAATELEQLGVRVEFGRQSKTSRRHLSIRATC